MDVHELSRRIDVPLRTVRYVLDRRLVPGAWPRRQESQVGRPRALTGPAAAAVALAAALSVGGVRSGTVRAVLGALARLKWPASGTTISSLTELVEPWPGTALGALCQAAAAPAVVEIGDGAAVRVTAPDRRRGWYDLRKRTLLPATVEFRVVVRVDCGLIGRSLASPPG